MSDDDILNTRIAVYSCSSRVGGHVEIETVTRDVTLGQGALDINFINAANTLGEQISGCYDIKFERLFSSGFPQTTSSVQMPSEPSAFEAALQRLEAKYPGITQKGAFWR